MPKESNHATRQAAFIADELHIVGAVFYLMAVLIVGTAVGAFLARQNMAGQGAVGRLLPILLVGEIIIYLSILIMPNQRFVPPRRAVFGVCLGIGTRGLMAFLTAAALRLGDPAASQTALFLQIYASRWIVALTHILLVLFYLWLTRSALESNEMRILPCRKADAYHEEYMRQQQISEEERRKRLLEALQDVKKEKIPPEIPSLESAQAVSTATIKQAALPPQERQEEILSPEETGAQNVGEAEKSLAGADSNQSGQGQDMQERLPQEGSVPPGQKGEAADLAAVDASEAAAPLVDDEPGEDQPSASAEAKESLMAAEKQADAASVSPPAVIPDADSFNNQEEDLADKISAPAFAPTEYETTEEGREAAAEETAVFPPVAPVDPLQLALNVEESKEAETPAPAPQINPPQLRNE